MRRTVASLLIVAFGMVGIASGAVAAFDVLGGSSEPVRVQRSHESATAGIGAPKDAQSDVAPVGDPVLPSTSTSARPDQDQPPGEQNTAGAAADEPAGALSDAFADLGIDDPTTTDVDESLPSPCTGLFAAAKPVACQVR